MRSRYLLLIILLSALSPAFAQRSHSSHSSKDSPDKTVHVHSYTKKNGTVVRSYKRRPAGSKARSADVSSSEVRLPRKHSSARAAIHTAGRAT